MERERERDRARWCSVTPAGAGLPSCSSQRRLVSRDTTVTGTIAVWAAAPSEPALDAHRGACSRLFNPAQRTAQSPSRLLLPEKRCAAQGYGPMSCSTQLAAARSCSPVKNATAHWGAWPSCTAWDAAAATGDVAQHQPGTGGQLDTPPGLQGPVRRSGVVSSPAPCPAASRGTSTQQACTVRQYQSQQESSVKCSTVRNADCWRRKRLRHKPSSQKAGACLLYS